MRAYETLRFEEYPDVADIQLEGRKTGVGGRQRGYVKPKIKRAMRRRMKRADKAKAERRWSEE